MNPWFALALTVLLAGCAGNKTEIPADWLAIIEAESPQPPAPPSECMTKGDPKWTIPPDRDELEAETARRDQTNKNAFREMAQRRRVCAAGLVTTLKLQ